MRPRSPGLSRAASTTAGVTADRPFTHRMRSAGSIAEFVWSQAPEAELIGLESGPSSAWLLHALRAEGLPVVVIDARHARAVLSLRINKTDRNDAVGLAELVRSR